MSQQTRKITIRRLAGRRKARGRTRVEPWGEQQELQEVELLELDC